MDKTAETARRTSEISDEEREAAKIALRAFDKFIQQLWSAHQHDARLLDVLDKADNVEPNSLFEIRHLIRKFQLETKNIYTNLIIIFAGKKDNNFNTIDKGIISLLDPLSKDTITKQIKLALQDAMQQLTDFMEEFLEAFEDFNSKDQISRIKYTAKKAEAIVKTIENIVEKQMKIHFERNVLGRKKTSSSKYRIRIIKMLEGRKINDY